MTSVTLAPSRVAAIRRALLGWYEAHGEAFPWRHARSPYWALVAGVCSQQTQMSRVLPLWQRWVEAFPDIEALARADTATVLRVWERAGYPRRALALREAARICVALHGGALPRDPQALLALPGVGPFTTAIVQCFGFEDSASAVDTNVIRVLGRLVYGDVQPAAETPHADIDATAARLLPHGNAGPWNATLMEYGAKVCTPRPHCQACVVHRLCAARPRFEAGAVAAPIRAQGRFAGSDRQWRGRIMRALRDADGPLRTPAFVRALASDEAERATVRRLLAALCAEGFAWSRSGRCGLGDPPSAIISCDA